MLVPGARYIDECGINISKEDTVKGMYSYIIAIRLYAVRHQEIYTHLI